MARSRSLEDELPVLIAAWPADRRRISRVLFSPPDWDDHPRSVRLPDRRLKTGGFPSDDTHELTLTLADRSDRIITVIPSDSGRGDVAALVRALGVLDHPEDDHPVWEDDGGHA